MITIQLPEYGIYVGEAWAKLNETIRQGHYSKVLVLVDEHTRQHCLPHLESALEFPFIPLEIPAGESHKNLDTCISIWSEMMDHQMDRRSICLNLGGGVIGDMGGFCASTFKRGMDFIQIPTTLLSQVDASIGGKLGIDFAQVKNSIGLFRNPRGVWVNPGFLGTLPEAEVRSGFAEVIKHSLIADATEWQKLKAVKNFKEIKWADLIPPSIRIKKRIVEQDPFERGLRKALNFGHTIGHALEGYALETDRPLLHGEAIAIGMVCEAYLSHLETGLPATQLEEIIEMVKKWYPVWPIPMEAFPHFLSLMKNDKKNVQSQVNFSLLEQIGIARVNISPEISQIEESLDFYNQRFR
jgi:3-dehydroquinate synthase